MKMDRREAKYRLNQMKLRELNKIARKAGATKEFFSRPAAIDFILSVAEKNTPQQ